MKEEPVTSLGELADSNKLSDEHPDSQKDSEERERELEREQKEAQHSRRRLLLDIARQPETRDLLREQSGLLEAGEKRHVLFCYCEIDEGGEMGEVRAISLLEFMGWFEERKKLLRVLPDPLRHLIWLPLRPGAEKEASGTGFSSVKVTGLKREKNNKNENYSINGVQMGFKSFQRQDHMAHNRLRSNGRKRSNFLLKSQNPQKFRKRATQSLDKSSKRPQSHASGHKSRGQEEGIALKVPAKNYQKGDFKSQEESKKSVKMQRKTTQLERIVNQRFRPASMLDFDHSPNHYNQKLGGGFGGFEVTKGSFYSHKRAIGRSGMVHASKKTGQSVFDIYDMRDKQGTMIEVMRRLDDRLRVPGTEISQGSSERPQSYKNNSKSNFAVDRKQSRSREFKISRGRSRSRGRGQPEKVVDSNRGFDSMIKNSTFSSMRRISRKKPSKTLNANTIDQALWFGSTRDTLGELSKHNSPDELSTKFRVKRRKRQKSGIKRRSGSRKSSNLRSFKLESTFNSQQTSGW